MSRWTCFPTALALAISAAEMDAQAQADPFARWEKAIAQFVAQDAKSPFPKGQVVFVGSSSIRLWDLKKSFPEVTTLNRGFGGSQLADAVHFLDRLVLVHQPRMAVFYAGDNDIAAGKSAAEVANDFRTFAESVGRRLPATKIIFLSIKPSPSRMKWIANQKAANEAIASLCGAQPNWRYVDVGSALLDSKGQPRPEYFKSDMLHLNEKGYAVWTAILSPLLAAAPAPKSHESKRPLSPAAIRLDDEAKSTVRVAGIVLKWIRGDKEANYRRLEPLVREAAHGGARLVCTTECFLDGYAIADKSIPLGEYRRLGEPIPEGEYCRKLAALAGELKIHLVAGMLEAAGDDRFNAAVMFGPDGRMVGKYRKQKLGHEAVRNRAGDASPVFATPYGNIGIMICADRTDAGIVRRLCDNGADWLICPSGGMFGPKTNDLIVQARSRENKVPIFFVHPAELLVTGKDGRILQTNLLGDQLLVPVAQVGTAKDQNRVIYFEMPIK